MKGPGYLLHGEALLVVSTGDPQHVALELKADRFNEELKKNNKQEFKIWKYLIIWQQDEAITHLIPKSIALNLLAHSLLIERTNL